MKKKKRSGYLSTGSSLIFSTAVMGSIPNISGTTAESNLKSKYYEGVGHIGSKFGAVGSIIGTRMVLKQVRKLKRKKSGLY